MNFEKLREDFEILNRRINGKPIIYLDSACMSLKPKTVLEKEKEYYEEYCSCAGRSPHKLANKLNEEIVKTREILKKFLNSKRAEEIVFNKNTTEGINLIANTLEFKKGDKVVISDKEHNSNLLPWLKLKQEQGITLEIVNTKNGILELEELKKKVKNAKLVSIVHTSNLDGVTNDVKEIIKISHDSKALVLLDGAQSVPHKEVDVRKLDVDFMAFSGHKMLGPTGTGVLYGKFELLNKLKQFIVGGETVVNSWQDRFELEKVPNRFEAGLQNYAGIVGLGEAANYLSKIRNEIGEYEVKLNKKITDGISEVKGVKILGEAADERGSIISIIPKDIDVHEMAMILSESANIMTRSGMHCVHSWFNKNKLNGSLRVSLYFYNTLEEAEIFVEEFKKVSEALR